jgi:mRNA interferase MazF
MEKDFFGWTKQKQKLHYKRKVKYFADREVWWCALGVNVGHEQDGKGSRYVRPVVIRKKFSADACLVVPLTGRRREGKYYVPIGSLGRKHPSAIISQLRFVDRRRLINKIGTVQKETFEGLRKAAKQML